MLILSSDKSAESTRTPSEVFRSIPQALMTCAPDREYKRYLEDTIVNLTTTKQTYTYSFTMLDYNDANVKSYALCVIRLAISCINGLSNVSNFLDI